MFMRCAASLQDLLDHQRRRAQHLSLGLANENALVVIWRISSDAIFIYIIFGL